MYGVSTESCVFATAIDAFAHDLVVTVVFDGTASVDWDLHEQTLERLPQQGRREAIESTDIQSRWRRRE
jgi:nicotinamidase-related amidase